MPLFKKKADRKKFSETTVGKFIKEKAPDILEKIGDRFPAVGLITDLISNHPKMSETDKATALEMAKIELQFEQNITDRWKSDADSGAWLAQNARPLVLLSAVLMLYIFIILDSCGLKFNVKPEWISLYNMMLITTIGAYFGLRSWDKKNAQK